jgi:hypothetical protein
LDSIEVEVFGEWHDGSLSHHLVAIMVGEMPELGLVDTQVQHTPGQDDIRRRGSAS